MSKFGELERITQNRVIELFRNQLGYEYLGNWQDRANNKPIEESLLRVFLSKGGYSPTAIDQAVEALKRAATDLTKGLLAANKAVYSLLRYGVQVKPDPTQNTQTVWCVDWTRPHNNHFAIAEEVSVTGNPHKKRPDIVLYINGIALGVLELKRSTVSISEGIRQNLDNQAPSFIPHFFSPIQLILAGNDSQGLQYGVIETPEKYYLTWKEDSHPQVKNLLDKQLLQMCEKSRFLELIHDFITYDNGIKKICRPHQYFGIKSAQASLLQREGGIIWHTQGSGKSLTMVWLAKWIRENMPNTRVLIVTDRTELDTQIEGVFRGVEEQILRTKSGTDLLSKLHTPEHWLLCSLVHKFGAKEETAQKEYIKELQSMPHFQPKGDMVVFVDECHRTQSGSLHEAMKQLLPNAIFVGFTGTPLLKSDKQKSIEVFGKYIHTYKFNEAVADGVVLDLCYEARQIDQKIKSDIKLDTLFDAKTKNLTPYAKAELKQKWSTMQNVLSSQSRLEQITNDIILDMDTKPRLSEKRGNAMLVAGSIYEACKYYELFKHKGFGQSCAIITSYQANHTKIKGEHTGELSPTDELKQYKIYTDMLAGKTTEVFEAEAKQQFINEPGKMRLLIVVDKLLTGFDAPSCTYLYIDKSMRDHKLFQAICRVNRLSDENKTYGYIVDYKDLFKSLEKSVQDYTSEAFDEYEQDDISGLINDRLTKAKERLDNSLEAFFALLEPVPMPREMEDFYHYFCGHSSIASELLHTAPRRQQLYKQTASLIRAYANMGKELAAAGYTPTQIAKIDQNVREAIDLRKNVKLRSGDYIDLKAYEADMRYLIDTYIDAEDSKKISFFNNVTLVKLLATHSPDEIIQKLPESTRKNQEAVAETIENNVRKLIIDEQAANPKFYEKMSELLDELIQARKDKNQDYAEYLAGIAELCQQIHNPTQSQHYPKTLDTNAKRVLYDNLDQDETLSLVLDVAVRYARKDDWRNNKFKSKAILDAVKKHLPDEQQAETIFEIIKKQSEY